MEFGNTLHNLRTRAGKSRYRLWQLTGLDQSYLSRLEHGEKNPSRNTVMLLGLALVHGCTEITCDDIDELLLAAGYAPLRDMRLRVLSRRSAFLIFSSCEVIPLPAPPEYQNPILRATPVPVTATAQATDI